MTTQLPPSDPALDNVIVLPGSVQPNLPFRDGPGGGPGVTSGSRSFGGADPIVAPTGAMLTTALEAVLFTSTSPVPLSRLRDVLLQHGTAELLVALRSLKHKYDAGAHGIEVVEVGGGWQLRTRAETVDWAARARGLEPVRLSRAALETLAIVAYRQPCTRSEVEAVRGVDVGGVLRVLLQRGLVRSMGRRREPGRPLSYGTTGAFLTLFGLRDLADLPTLRDLRELQADDPRDGAVPVQEAAKPDQIGPVEPQVI
jgi:segregation and condensation protein B